MADITFVLDRSIGKVASVTGAAVCLDWDYDPRNARQHLTVGCFLGLESSGHRLVGIVSEMHSLASPVQRDTPTVRAHVQLVGEITASAERPVFSRGVTAFPSIGDEAHLLGADDLAVVFAPQTGGSPVIGTVQQEGQIPAVVNVNELISKHFAVLGATGVGKSSGVAVIVNAIIGARPDARVFLLDGHNEYGRCFGERASVVTPRTLKLPFWLFNFEEFVDVLFGGRAAVPEEIEILSELIPIARGMYGSFKAANERLALKRVDSRGKGLTVDTPSPYLIQDLIGLIDERMGRLENRSLRMHHHRLMGRIDVVRHDPRYAFMFENANVGGDTMARLLGQFFRFQPEGSPITVMQLAGLPAEVIDAIVCVFCRLAFEFGVFSEGALPLVFICEEAHRYASSNNAAGFHPTRRALSRIAKEGRKYRISLGIVSQRPAELDPTIISQCSTIFAMRMTNDRDQELLRSAVADGSSNLLAYVPSLRTREAVAFGEGVPIPARIRFDTLEADRLPRADSAGTPPAERDVCNPDFVRSVVERWRGATMTGRTDSGAADATSREASPAQALRETLRTGLAESETEPRLRPTGLAS